MKPRDAIPEIQQKICALETIKGTGTCLYSAHLVADCLWNLGERVVIQAGSLQWPRVRREEDDGAINTHFSYMWTPDDPASIAAMAAGKLPEMHVWAGLIDHQEIIDFSVGQLEKEAARAGLAWTADPPPAYLWASADRLPDWVIYTPNRDATILACKIIRNLFDPEYLKGARL